MRGGCSVVNTDGLPGSPSRSSTNRTLPASLSTWILVNSVAWAMETIQNSPIRSATALVLLFIVHLPFLAHEGLFMMFSSLPVHISLQPWSHESGALPSRRDHPVQVHVLPPGLDARPSPDRGSAPCNYPRVRGGQR